MASQDPEQPATDEPDLFSHIVGRALMDHDFRVQLVEGDDETRVAALEAAGLSTTQANEVLPTLEAAVSAVDAFAGEFGIRPYAA